MSIKEMEALLEATRQKIAGQARLNECCVDARLLEKERMLEQAVSDAHFIEMLTPPVKRLFRNGVEHTLIQEQSNEEIDAFIERKILEEQNTSNSKWVHNARKQVELPYKPVMELADLIAPHEGDKE